MVELNDMIIDYITSLYEIKGGTVVYCNGDRVYFDEIHKHITSVFNLDDFVAIGYLISCFSETELDYDMFVCKTRPLSWVKLLLADVDDNLANRYGYLPNPVHDDMVMAAGFAIMGAHAP